MKIQRLQGIQNNRIESNTKTQKLPSKQPEPFKSLLNKIEFIIQDIKEHNTTKKRHQKTQSFQDIFNYYDELRKRAKSKEGGSYALNYMIKKNLKERSLSTLHFSPNLSFHKTSKHNQSLQMSQKKQDILSKSTKKIEPITVAPSPERQLRNPKKKKNEKLTKYLHRRSESACGPFRDFSRSDSKGSLRRFSAHQKSQSTTSIQQRLCHEILNSKQEPKFQVRYPNHSNSTTQLPRHILNKSQSLVHKPHQSQSKEFTLAQKPSIKSTKDKQLQRNRSSELRNYPQKPIERPESPIIYDISLSNNHSPIVNLVNIRLDQQQPKVDLISTKSTIQTTNGISSQNEKKKQSHSINRKSSIVNKENQANMKRSMCSQDDEEECEDSFCKSVEIINTKTIVSRNNQKFEVHQYKKDDTTDQVATFQQQDLNRQNLKQQQQIKPQHYIQKPYESKSTKNVIKNKNCIQTLPSTSLVEKEITSKINRVKQLMIDIPSMSSQDTESILKIQQLSDCSSVPSINVDSFIQNYQRFAINYEGQDSDRLRMQEENFDDIDDGQDINLKLECNEIYINTSFNNKH